VRVALACPYAWDAPGGVQTHVRQLAARLLDDGHEVLVLAPSSSEPAEPWVRGVGRPVRIPFNGSIAPITPTPASSRRVRAALEAFRPDVVHAHEPFVPGTAMFATNAARAPVVATFHAYADRAFALRAAAPLLRSVWRRLDVRLAVSEAAREFVGRAFGAERVRIVPNGADVALFRDASPAEGLPEGERILFVNRLDPRKGFSTAIHAFERLAAERPAAHLVVAGDGEERSAYERLPAAVRARVVMLGSVEHDRLPPYHAASDVFLGPALGRESFGIVLVEAMAAGLPVVASDIPGYREVVRDGIDGVLVPPGDPGALASATARVLDDADLRARLAAAGRARAERFDWDVVATEVMAAYREALR
jgi:phosphatidyl-myo-inositol alpha-mannosyltransferase